MSESDCIFCKMVNGEIQADVVYENDHVLGFRDITPRAPVHVLVIPKAHIPTLADLEDPEMAAQCLLAARKVAELEGISESGYRTVINCKKAGGQEVYHLHLHVLGGRDMAWPPG